MSRTVGADLPAAVAQRVGGHLVECQDQLVSGDLGREMASLRPAAARWRRNSARARPRQLGDVLQLPGGTRRRTGEENAEGHTRPPAACPCHASIPLLVPRGLCRSGRTPSVSVPRPVASKPDATGIPLVGCPSGGEFSEPGSRCSSSGRCPRRPSSRSHFHRGQGRVRGCRRAATGRARAPRTGTRHCTFDREAGRPTLILRRRLGQEGDKVSRRGRWRSSLNGSPGDHGGQFLSPSGRRPGRRTRTPSRSPSPRSATTSTSASGLSSTTLPLRRWVAHVLVAPGP